MLFQAHNAESECCQAVFKLIWADGYKRWAIMVPGHQTDGGFRKRVCRATQDALLIRIIVLPQDWRLFTHVGAQFKTIFAQMVAFAD